REHRKFHARRAGGDQHHPALRCRPGLLADPSAGHRTHCRRGGPPHQQRRIDQRHVPLRRTACGLSLTTAPRISRGSLPTARRAGRKHFGLLFIWRNTMNNFTLEAQVRSDLGKGASRRLRRNESLVPAVVYGGDKAPQSISLVAKDFAKLLENEAAFSHVLTLNVGSAKESVLIKALQ